MNSRGLSTLGNVTEFGVCSVAWGAFSVWGEMSSLVAGRAGCEGTGHITELHCFGVYQNNKTAFIAHTQNIRPNRKTESQMSPIIQPG